MSLPERFWSKVDKSGDCWEWTAYRAKNGYGMISVRTGHPALAHRVAWQLERGDIPAGMQLDHLCRNRGCVNPDHLEVVSNKTNTLRGIGPTAVNAKKSVCKRGHSLDDAYVCKGLRYCRTCALLKQSLLRATGSGRLG